MKEIDPFVAADHFLGFKTKNSKECFRLSAQGQRLSVNVIEVVF